MKLSPLRAWLLIIIIIIIIIIIVIVILVIPIPVPDPGICPVCRVNAVKLLGIAGVALGLVSLGLISRIKNQDRIN
ncbi:MAG: hypothetical protein Q8941_01375 [Bacteroidota bacterium]|nr:hypothetical protein [Bacteroidota bacterium]